jgi:glycosyltransferase involved in cell wall biosynthesis
MSLLYFHSPLPPAQTGIADYAFETLARLKDHFDIVIVDEGDSRASADALLLPTMPVAVWRDLRMRSAKGLDIYHLGNNRFHTGILQRALGHPGLCVIHDASLTGLLLSSPSLHPVFRRFTEYELGTHADRFIAARERFEIFDWQDFLLRNLGLVADSSLGIVVHSQYVEAMIRRRHRPHHLFHLNHHLADQFRTRRGAAIADPLIGGFLRKNEGRVKVATFGFLTPPKRVDWLVEAVKRALNAGADIALILGGKAHPDTKISELVRQLPTDRVLVTGYLSEADMRGLMCATDLHIALRFPSVGETSGTLTRALGLGVPSVVLDHEAFSDIADDHVVKLPLTSDAGGALGDILVDFCADRQKYTERAAIAQRWIFQNASLERSVEGFVEAVRTVVREKPCASNFFRDLAGELLPCITASAKHIRLAEPVVMPEDLAERVGDALMTDRTAAAVVRMCQAEYLSLVVDPRRDRSSIRRRMLHDSSIDRVRRRKAVLVVSSLDLQIGNIDYVVVEIGIERFDALLFVLLPVLADGPAERRRRPAERRNRSATRLFARAGPRGRVIRGIGSVPGLYQNPIESSATGANRGAASDHRMRGLGMSEEGAAKLLLCAHCRKCASDACRAPLLS